MTQQDDITQRLRDNPVADERAAFSRAEISFPLTIPENRVYLAGPMSGIAEHNFPAFHAAAERLRGLGLDVVNPADHGLVDGLGWADYMRWDLVKLAGCHSVYVLPGWEKSKGASLEISIARALGMPVFTVDGAALASAPVAKNADELSDYERGFAAGWDQCVASAPVADERAALQKLVDLEDMRLRLRALHENGHGTDYDHYHKALPAAWEAARAALASAPVTGNAVCKGSMALGSGCGKCERCRAEPASAPVADERAAIAEATAHVTEALMYVDRVAQRKAIGYADFGTNPRRNHSDTRPYNLKDARSDAYTAAILLRKAWDILDPSISFKPAAALASAPMPVLKDWRIDTSAGGPILVYKDCSVIESAQAEYVLRLIAADQASAPVAGEAPTDADLDKLYRETVTEGPDNDTRCWENPHRLYARAVLSRYAAPQASAEDVHNAALEEAIQAISRITTSYATFTSGNPLYRPESRPASAAIAEAIDTLRALKTRADKDGGQQCEGGSHENA
ncbi:DUF4406 domain-containing protein [Achromobacter xylosoxidans]|uniref:DUF4406 domain-containing protein n=1 Tax=Alcaligenes xylosoxydans xylosoxydans TaxID=85698 RepID=UPI003369F87C